MTSPATISTGLTQQTTPQQTTRRSKYDRDPKPPSQSITSDHVTISPTTNPEAIKPETTNSALNPAKASKPPYQFIIDFFQELGQKILDIFTPTSKEAIEKALLQSQLKTEAYEARIASNREKLDKGGLSELQKEVLNQDIQKAEKKLGKYQTKIDTLGAKLNTLASNTAQETEAKVTQEVKNEAATKASSSASKHSAADGLEKATQESVEDFLKEAESLINKAKETVPEFVDELVAFFKKVLH